MDQLDAVHIFSGDNGRLSKALIRDRADHMHDPVSHRDTKLRRPPFILLNRCDHAAANMVFVGSRIRNVARRLTQIKNDMPAGAELSSLICIKRDRNERDDSDLTR